MLAPPEAKARIDLLSGRRGDEGGSRDVGDRDRGHVESTPDLGSEGLVVEPKHQADPGIDVLGRQGGIEVRQVIVGRENHRLGLADSRELKGLLDPAVPGDQGHPEVVNLIDERRVPFDLHRDDRFAEGEELLDQLEPNLPDTDDDDVVLVERGDHPLPLLKILLLGERQKREADQRIRHRAQADNGDEKEERLEIPIVGELERVLEEDEKENPVTGLDVVHALATTDHEPADEDQPPKHAERPPKLPQERAEIPEIDLNLTGAFHPSPRRPPPTALAEKTASIRESSALGTPFRTTTAYLTLGLGTRSCPEIGFLRQRRRKSVRIHRFRARKVTPTLAPGPPTIFVERESMRLRALVCLFFFLSGAAGLVYQVVWSKLLGLVLGNTVYSLTVVLATFMGGLGLGSYLAGRIADRLKRPLLAYGVLEGIIGVYCALLPFLILGAETFFRTAMGWMEGSNRLVEISIRIVVAAALLLLPTALMGATLPILSRFFIPRREQFGSSLAFLYAINTFGAVAGSWLSGFFLIPSLGLKGSSFVAAAANLTILVATLLLLRKDQAPEAPASDPNSGPDHSDQKASPDPSNKTSRGFDLEPYRGPGVPVVSLFVIGLAGAASLIDQIAWTRVFALCLGSSVYAFSVMVGTFILGLALGSALVGKIVDRSREPLLTLGSVQAAVGALVLGTVWILSWFPLEIADVVAEHGSDFSRLLLEEFWRVAAILILPTAFMGAAFPIATYAFARPGVSVARAVGTVYAANTIGAIAGSILGGFLLLPLLGTYGSLLLAAGINFAGAILCLFPSIKRIGSVAGVCCLTAMAAAVLTLVFLPRWDPRVLTCGPFLYSSAYRQNEAQGLGTLRDQLSEHELLYFNDGITATVTVTQDKNDGSKALAVNGKVDASTSGDMPTQLLLGHLPVVIHDGPVENALVVGLGSGATLAACLRHEELAQVDCVEISAGIIEAARLHFTSINDGVLDPGADPRLNMIEDDARNFVSLSKLRYDIITSEPSNPWMAGIGNLFSAEFFDICVEHLAPSGIMCQWVHASWMSIEDFRVIIRTFLHGFKDVVMFESIPAGDYLLLGSNDPISIPVDLLTQRLREGPVRESLTRIGMETPAPFLSTFVAGRQALTTFAGDGPLHTDNNAYLEFSTPRSLLDSEVVIEQGKHLLKLRDSVWPYLDTSSITDLDRLKKEIEQHEEGRYLTRSGAVRLRSRDAVGAGAAFTQALAILPRDNFVRENLLLLKLEEARALFASQRNLERVKNLAAEALALDPEDGRPQELLGYVELQSRRFDSAIDYLRQSVEKRPYAQLAWMNLGVAEMENELWEEARSSLEKARELKPTADTLMNLARVYIKENRYRDAADLYRNVLRLEPGDLEAINGLAFAMSSAGRSKAAAEEIEKFQADVSPENRQTVEEMIRYLKGGQVGS